MRAKPIYSMVILIFFISIIGLTNLILNIRDFFIPELLVLLLFIISAVIITYNLYNQRRTAWIMSLFFFVAYLINITFLYFYSQNQALFVLLMLTTIIGFILSIENIKGKAKTRPKKEIVGEEEHIKIERPSEPEVPDIVVEEVKPSKHFVKTRVKKPKKKKITKKPIKRYIASRKGVNYHEPKCRWAKKILPKRKIFFKNRKEAEEEGFKPCKCVK